MKALFFDQVLQLKKLELPPLNADEALIKVCMAGICNTDLEIIRGYMNFTGVLGHEFVGEVIACQNQSWIGKRVIGEINICCESCSYCQKGLPRHCSKRQVLGIYNHPGVFAEACILPIRNLHELPQNITDEEGVLIEPIAAAYEILEQITIQPNHSVAILGDGKLAQICARVIQRTGCQLTVFGKHQHKLDLLKRLNISTQLIPIKQENNFDIIIEATGHPNGLKTAISHIRPRGIIIMKSTFHHTHTINLNECVINEIHLIGSRCGPFKPAIHLLMDNKISVKDLISDVIEFDNWESAFKMAQESHNLKIILKMK